ncbi:hypothetical protein PIROE2DRAFT_7996 [Piromyces sp. E2]|nr:hypothetical protein PIROE2DRAFT_7996 [Piromyces sp. E2]|eukprot:OUM65104.1 hypothetical protein PIROE2DRAFT_7996 [Piromyces sp. E2]
MAGRYRPDFISVCDVDFNKVEEQYNYYKNITNNENYGPRNLFNTTICRASPEVLYEERKIAFSNMTYLALYIAGQIHLLDKKSYIWKYLVVFIPFVFAIIVPLTRVMDYRHHWQDVTIGSFIGIFFAVITYFYYYPSLRNPNCDIPYQRYNINSEQEQQSEVL